MKVNVAFTLDIDPAEWEGRLEGEPQPVTLDEATTARIAAEAASHAESVVRDLYYDQGWIAEHHPAGHPDKADCWFCEPVPTPSYMQPPAFPTAPRNTRHSHS